MLAIFARMEPLGGMSEPAPELSEPPTRQRSRPIGLVLSIAALAIGIGLGTTGVVRFGNDYQSVPQQSRSMVPTLNPGDEILILSGPATPRRGDIVLVKPGSWPYLNSPALKRVIGLPGDTLTCCDEHNRLIVDGHPVTEDYVQPDPTLPPDAAQNLYFSFHDRVPPGTVFVAGDNRENSMDSRFVGPVADSDLLGTVVTDWPLAGPFASVPTTTAFVAAGLPGPATHDTGYLLDLWLFLAGALLALVGVIWLVVIGVRAVIQQKRTGRARTAASGY